MLKNVILFTVLKSKNNKYVPLKKNTRERERNNNENKIERNDTNLDQKKRQIANSFQTYPLFNHI